MGVSRAIRQFNPANVPSCLLFRPRYHLLWLLIEIELHHSYDLMLKEQVLWLCARVHRRAYGLTLLHVNDTTAS